MYVSAHPTLAIHLIWWVWYFRTQMICCTYFDLHLFAFQSILLFSLNLTIPPPSEEVPQTVAPSESGSTSKSKKGKLMEPSKALTARYVFLLIFTYLSLMTRLGIFLLLITWKTTLIWHQLVSRKYSTVLTTSRARYLPHLLSWLSWIDAAIL